MSFKRTDHGIKYGKSELRCFCSDRRYGTVGIVTPKTDGEIVITFTPGGNVYIYRGNILLTKITKKRPPTNPNNIMRKQV